MKKLNSTQWRGLLLGGALLGAAQLSALAGIFTWSAPTTVTTADAALAQTGTIVGAEVFGTDSKLVVLSDGTTVDFKSDFTVAQVIIGSSPGSAYGGFTNNDSGNTAFKATLTQFNYDNGPKTITVFGLTPGQLYSVQLFAMDRRDTNAAARLAYYQDPNDVSNVSATFAMGDNAYVIGTFTAPGTTVDIQEILPTQVNSGNINALVVRAIGTNIPAQITTQPQPATLYNGTTATLTAGALGTGPLSYQWQKSNIGGTLFTNVVNGGNISGANSNSLVIGSLVAGDEGDYLVVVSNPYGNATSSVVTLTVLAGTPQFVWSTPAAITTADATLNQSGSVVGATVFGPTSRIVVLTNGTSVDFKNDAVVATATGAGVTIGAFAGQNTGNSDFNTVLNEFNYDNGPKTITLTNLVAGQQYAVQLFALDNRLGGNGGATVRYANYQDPNDAFNVSSTFQMGDNVYLIGTFTASNNSVAIQENLPTANGGNINALVLRRLTGLPVAPNITTQPQGATLVSGANAQFTVGANGSSLVYQWQRATVGSGVFSNVGGANASGTNAARLILTNVNSGSVADYRIIISNGAGSVTSSPAATLNVNSTVTLAHRWSFSETNGTTTTADSVGGANGTLQGGAFLGGGFVALTNPATAADNCFVSIPGGLLKNMASVTVQCWVTNNGWANGNTFVGFGGETDPSGSGTNFIDFFARWAGSQSAFQIQTTSGDSGIVTLGTRVNYNSGIVAPSPANYAYLYDPNVGTVTLYTNGVLSGSATGVAIPLSTLGTNLGTIGRAVWNTNFGASIPTTSGNFPFMKAGFSEVRIYNGVLNSNVIVEAFQLGPDSVPAAPQITSQPSPTSAGPGATATFTVGATGNPLNYKWQRAAVGSGTFTNLSNAGNISGVTTNQLVVTNMSVAEVADYRVIISNGSGAVTSSPAATLTLLTVLEHRWSFSEASGSTTADTIGGSTGTLQGGAVLGGGFVRLANNGSAADDSYVSIPGGLLNNMAAVSVECWVTNNGWNNGNTFVGFGGDTDPSGSGTNFINFFSRWAGSISAFQIQTFAGDSGIVNLGTRVNYNSATTQPSPAHYAYVYNPGAGSVVLYTNGVLSGSGTGVVMPLSLLGTNLGTIGKAVWNTNFGAIIPTTSGNRPFMNAGFSEVRIYNGVLSSSAIAADFQLGPDLLLPTATTNKPTMNLVSAPGNLTISWSTTNSAFFVESSPLLGAGAVWKVVSGNQTIVGPNYQMTLPTTNGPAMFFRLRQ